MMTQIGKLTDEDLARYRAITARREAYKVHPDGYGVGEIEQNEMAHIRFLGGLVEQYGIDDTRAWKISQYSGVIIYGDWEE